MTMSMNVSEFRRQVDHLCKLHNCDRFACTGRIEAERHIEAVRDVFDEVKSAQCTRAQPYDRELHRKIVQEVGTWLNAAETWVASLPQEVRR